VSDSINDFNTFSSDENYFSGCRVLIVDDCEDNLELFSAFLGASGAIVSTALNGAEAISAFAVSSGRFHRSAPGNFAGVHHRSVSDVMFS
jgi:CheY-like chemotaxis protein